MSKRLEALQQMIAQDPDNAFARYGLAQELANLGRLEEAVAEFERLIARKPDYFYAYFHGGKALEKLGRTDEARSLYRRGLEASSRGGDAHAQSEIQAALDMIGAA